MDAGCVRPDAATPGSEPLPADIVAKPVYTGPKLRETQVKPPVSAGDAWIARARRTGDRSDPMNEQPLASAAHVWSRQLNRLLCRVLAVTIDTEEDN